MRQQASKSNRLLKIKKRHPGPDEDRLRQRHPIWVDNPSLSSAAAVLPSLPLGRDDLDAAAERLQRWAPALMALFPELRAEGGLIESRVLPISEPADVLGMPLPGRCLLKADHALPLAGSIKARGGIYEVLCFAEQVGIEAGLIAPGGDPLALVTAKANACFEGFRVGVGSTGNLGLSIGMMASALGFATTVHMSSDAKAWKKARLREHGVRVVEHAGDYAAAVAAGREEMAGDRRAHFVDDENSRMLLLGYAVAALRLRPQLEALGIHVSRERPLWVYLPCGVGGAPGGIAWGLKHVYGDAVQCFFAEPVAAPAFALRMLADGPCSVREIGLDGVTEADGLAVGQASELAFGMVRELLGGVFTVTDDELMEVLVRVGRATGERIEPSAAAGFLGPRRMQEAGGSCVNRMSGESITHLFWTTGGAFVPEEEYRGFYARGVARLSESGAPLPFMGEGLNQTYQETMMRKYGHWINGHEYAGAGDAIERRCPGDGKPVASFAAGTVHDVDAAISAAEQAFSSRVWSDTPAIERARILHRWADLIDRHLESLATIEAEESGKPIRFARDEVHAAAEMARFAASLAQTRHGDAITDLGGSAIGLVSVEPAGVVGMIVPWNFPLVTLFQKLPFALAAGCTAVIKPSELTSGTALETARLAHEAGIPQGVINIVTGSGAVVGAAILKDPRIRVVSFTGSTRVGRQIGAVVGGRLGRVALELGGKAANLVFADADLDAAADGVLFGAVLNQGEECVAGTRLLIERSIEEAFVAELVKRAGKVRVRHPLDPEGDIGALIHEDHLDRVLGHVRRALADGATLACGGERLTGGALGDGCYLPPTILTEVTPGMPIFREEVFGPVLTVTAFDTQEEAIALANATEYGLGNGVWSQNVNTLHEVSRRLQSGTVYANTYLETTPQLPFGGFKHSGLGREMGLRALDEFSEYKSTFLRLGKRPFSLEHTR